MHPLDVTATNTTAVQSVNFNVPHSGHSDSCSTEIDHTTGKFLHVTDWSLKQQLTVIS